MEISAQPLVHEHGHRRCHRSGKGHSSRRKRAKKIAQRDPFAFNGRQVTGGLSTIRDSAWVMSWNCERQPHFKAQPKDQIVIWITGQEDDRPGDFVKKPMRECTGEEITREWLYHLGVPTEQIPEIDV